MNIKKAKITLPNDETITKEISNSSENSIDFLLIMFLTYYVPYLLVDFFDQKNTFLYLYS